MSVTGTVLMSIGAARSFPSFSLLPFFANVKEKGAEMETLCFCASVQERGRAKPPVANNRNGRPFHWIAFDVFDG